MGSTAAKKTRDFVHELLQVIDRHVLEVDLLSTVDVGGIGKNTDRHPWSGDIWESGNVNQTLVRSTVQISSSLDGPRKTLVPLGVVIFQTDL